MSYLSALEAAGAKVHNFGHFGCYQGDWWAKVSFQGKKGWVHGGFGSCSGCDAFQMEFGYGDEDDDDYQDRLKAFGLRYLDYILTQKEAEESAAENISWDLDADEMLQFIKDNK